MITEDKPKRETWKCIGCFRLCRISLFDSIASCTLGTQCFITDGMNSKWKKVK